MDAIERFLAYARVEAVDLRNEYIGPEHLALGIVRNHADGLEPYFSLFRVAPSDVSDAILNTSHRGDSPVGDRDLPVTRRAKQLLDSYSRLSSDYSKDNLRPEYLVLAILSDRFTVPCQAMRKLKIREDVWADACESGPTSVREARQKSFWDMPWYQKVLLVLVIWPMGLVVFIPVFLLISPLGLFAVSFNYIGQRCIRASMRRAGRFVSLKAACERIEAEGGTLILETPSLGWNFQHLWWTPDDVLATIPFPEPRRQEYLEALEQSSCLDWDRWLWENYVCLNHGRAVLLGVWNVEALGRTLTTRFPNLPLVRTWSALVHDQDRMAVVVTETP